MLNKQLLDNGFLLVKNMVSVDIADGLYRELVDKGQTKLHFLDNEFHGPCYNYQSPTASQELLFYLLHDMVDIVGESLFPTYSYMRLYKHNAFLNPHTDRPACEVSLTVHLGSDKEWEFGIRNYRNNNEFNVVLEQGDALVYLGCVAPHWRNGKYTGENFAQCFLHYVRSRGRFSYCINDIDRSKPDGMWEDSLKLKYDSWIGVTKHN